MLEEWSGWSRYYAAESQNVQAFDIKLSPSSEHRWHRESGIEAQPLQTEGPASNVGCSRGISNLLTFWLCHSHLHIPGDVGSKSLAWYLATGVQEMHIYSLGITQK